MRVCEVEYNRLNHWICLHYYLRFQYGSIPCKWDFLINLWQNVHYIKMFFWCEWLFCSKFCYHFCWVIGSLWNTPSHRCEVEIKDRILYETGQKKNRWLHLSSHLKQKTQELSCLGSALPLADYLKPISIHKYLNNKLNSAFIIEKLVFVILVNHFLSMFANSYVCRLIIASQALQCTKYI